VALVTPIVPDLNLWDGNCHILHASGVSRCDFKDGIAEIGFLMGLRYARCMSFLLIIVREKADEHL
jgi:hypothetical protein